MCDCSKVKVFWLSLSYMHLRLVQFLGLGCTCEMPHPSTDTACCIDDDAFCKGHRQWRVEIAGSLLCSVILLGYDANNYLAIVTFSQ